MKADKWIGCLIIIFSAFMYYQATILPKPPFYADSLGPDFFPKVVFAVLGVLGLILTAVSIFGERKQKPSNGRSNNIDASDAGTATLLHSQIKPYIPVVVTILLFIVYVAIMFYIGFIISTLIFLPVLMIFLGPKTKQSFKYIIIISTVSGFGIYFFFHKIIKIFLPPGTFF